MWWDGVVIFHYITTTKVSNEEIIISIIPENPHITVEEMVEKYIATQGKKVVKIHLGGDGVKKSRAFYPWIYTYI